MSIARFPLLVSGVIALEGALLTWNAWHYDWLRGYDAFANHLYADVVANEYRLPSTSDSGVWHTPPLWFALAGGLERMTAGLGWGHAQRPAQLLAAAAGLAVCVLAFLLARELWPERRGLQLVALVLTASSPALVRASAMFHPETLAVALAVGGLFVAVRGLRRRATVLTGLGAGVLLGLASLTRGWALPVLVAVALVLALNGWQCRKWGPTLALVAVAAVCVGPWLANQQLAHGNPLAFNREAPSTALLERRPASFYLGPRALAVFERPVTPRFRNELVPQLYADWWGDWALAWDSPPPPPPWELLPDRVLSARIRQSLVGIVPTVLALAGLLTLALVAASRRSSAIGVLPLTALAVAIAFAIFAVRFPSTDGDTLKATYLLLVLVPAAVGAGFVVDVLRPPGRMGALVVGAMLVALAAVQAPFLIL